MRSFKTTDGIEWKVNVSVLAIKRVHAEVGVRLDEIFNGDADAQRFLQDQLQFADVLVSLLRPQLVERNKSPDDLLCAMDDATLEAAGDALVEEVADFFREPRRTILREMLTKTRTATARLRDEAVTVARQKLAEIDVDKMTRELMHSSTASNSPESAASTRGTTPSENST